ncbi:hypothetical protein [Plantactinospora sp. KLBMP9567]|uniref:hypothetical protein n=1 Tax=Plantactinospora sp. KLBMP9567 TaxID=3085900 RepID=UPI00298186D4|nr:hypothetical protein [Plantactinospora sp. KLBMP9567]MDW5324665.1 hypothetical protein [Plantactinospora sp. KLBMP9567]
MRSTRVLLMVFAAAGTLSVLAAAVSADHAVAQCALVASAALIGYVLLAGPAAPRVRPALAAGIALLALPTAMELWRGSAAPATRQSLIPIYTPLGGSAAPTGRTALPSILDQWRQALDQERLASVGLLLGVLCLAVAVLALPARQRPKTTVLAGVVAVLLLLIVGADVWSRVDGEPLLGLLGTAWPALLATLAAAGVLALSASRADRVALVPLGALLVAVSAAVAFHDLTRRWVAWWTFSNPDDGVLLSAGVAVSLANVVDVPAALLAAVTLTGPALLAVGTLRASRAADPT